MPYDPLAHVDAQIRERAARIGLVCLDVDGTLTDGRLYFDGDGREIKSFNVLDGQGLTQLRRFGIHVALITARNSQAAKRRGDDLRLETFIGVKDKLTCMDELAASAAGTSSTRSSSASIRRSTPSAVCTSAPNGTVTSISSRRVGFSL